VLGATSNKKRHHAPQRWLVATGVPSRDVTTPELRQMRYVTAVAKERSFSRAAETLGVAQQALSQQVRAVEDLLGVQLFERTNRGVRITPAGEVFVQEARRTLTAADRMSRRTQAAGRGEVGTLRLAYTLATVYETLPELVDSMAVAQPDVRVLPAETFGGDIHRLLTDERFDVALAPRPGDDVGREVDGLEPGGSDVFHGGNVRKKSTSPGGENCMVYGGMCKDYLLNYLAFFVKRKS